MRKNNFLERIERFIQVVDRIPDENFCFTLYGSDVFVPGDPFGCIGRDPWFNTKGFTFAKLTPPGPTGFTPCEDVVFLDSISGRWWRGRVAILEFFDWAPADLDSLAKRAQDVFRNHTPTLTKTEECDTLQTVRSEAKTQFLVGLQNLLLQKRETYEGWVS